VRSIDELESAFAKARKAKVTQVIVIETDPMAITDAGGAWWDVAVPEVSSRETVVAARSNYEKALETQRMGD
jgi:3D-(3,5/4)-trihydroxycyclohexane-1,2-dione acylhydrolase (decyclizing)